MAQPIAQNEYLEKRSSLNRFALIYPPLAKPNSTRLIHLHAGSGSDPLTCHLTEIDLDAFPIYEAISYTWGTITDERPITINGTSIAIRANLYAFLLRLRDKTSEKALWVDALSISQTNLDEKAEQVAMIGRIFQQARLVRAWVGEHADGSELLFNNENDVVRVLSKWTKYSILFRRLRHIMFGMGVFAGLVVGAIAGSLISWTKGIDIGVPVGVAILLFYTISSALLFMFFFPISKRELSFRTIPQWRSFVDRLYFRRVWIIQEIALARSIIVHCGDSSKEWAGLINRYLGYDGGSSSALTNAQLTPNHWRRPTDGEVVFLNVLRQTSREDLHNRPKSIGDLVFETRHAECEDQRDRLYALLSMENENRGPSRLRTPIIPNYRISIPELFVQVYERRALDTQRSFREVMKLIEGLQVTRLQAWTIWQLLNNSRGRALFAVSYLGYLIRTAVVPASYEFTYSFR